MKTITINNPFGVENIQTLPSNDPGKPLKGQIRVAIKANSLNFHDLMVVKGLIPTQEGRILLSDGVGVVEAVGEGVSEFVKGDTVVSTFFPNWLNGAPTSAVSDFSHTPGDGIDGMASEYVVRDTSAFTHAPVGWSYVEASTITTSGLTAWRALIKNGRLKAGSTVLVQGTGGVSIAALQLAKGAGAKVIVTSSSDAKLAQVKKLGADGTINYKTHPQWGEQVLAMTGGCGVDYIVEVGGPATMAESLKAIKVGGHISLIGVLSGNEVVLPMMEILSKQVRLESLIVGSRQDQIDYVKALEAINQKPIIDTVFEHTDVTKAFEHLEGGAHFGKVCLSW
ncbi:zinc-dependent alcohol dehydrogenase family protein [Rosenbergiella nectarea]|uniref:zinc-dependent alcohol dehydrogenase family protein n=1 Tax=Rosenbergiella nectarea TaxID=988801 RepID=UPI001F4E9ADE|nr:NAD(P)-dependent alcohol dehydrogenase [Rosenbergiella nectarea]